LHHAPFRGFSSQATLQPSINSMMGGINCLASFLLWPRVQPQIKSNRSSG
jgi:hypothetical protein